MKIPKPFLYLPLAAIASTGCYSASETVNEQTPANVRSQAAANAQNPAVPRSDQTPPAGSFGDRVNRRKPLEVPASGTPIPLTFTDAGENSQVASTMDSDGSVREIRVFRGHPVLSRVEMTWLTPKNKVLRITLKDGKIVEANTDRIENLKQATSATILAAAGISPPAGQTKPRQGAARP